MAAKIKLKRIGRKKRPFFRIVIADERKKASGSVVETIGYYDPITTPPKIKIDNQALQKWLSFGVQPTDSVRKLLKL